MSAHTYRFVKLSREALILECGVLNNQTKAAAEEINSNQAEVQILHKSLVVMHERERRLEDMVLQLCNELGTAQAHVPKSKDYNITANEAIDAYVRMQTKQFWTEKAEWEAKHKELEQTIQNRRAAMGLGPSTNLTLATTPNRKSQSCQVELETEEDGKDTKGKYKQKFQALRTEYMQLQQSLTNQGQDAELALQVEELQDIIAERRAEIEVTIVPRITFPT